MSNHVTWRVRVELVHVCTSHCDLGAQRGGAAPKYLAGPNLRPTIDVLQATYGL